MKPSRSARRAPATPALQVLHLADIAHVVHEFAHDPSSALPYGLEAAEALGADPARVFKTLVTVVDEALVVAIVPVTARLDLKALAATVHGRRASLADAALAERATGYVTGGISPFGQRRRLRTVLDEHALDHETIWVSAGRRGLEVEIATTAVIAVTEAISARLTRES